MATFLRAIESLSLALWIGSDVFVSLVLAPGAFRLLGVTGRDQAGMIVGFALGRMHIGGIACGLIFLIARVARTRALASLTAAPAVCVALMIVLTAISQYTVSARMASLRVQMGSIQATAADSPLLAEFGRLHRLSVSLESGVLLAGFAAIYFIARESTLLR